MADTDLHVDSAELGAEERRAELTQARRLAERYRLACNLEARPAFTYTRDKDEVETIEKEVELARRLGLPASLTRDTGLPFEVLAAMRWDDQAQFHPVRYVKGLAETIPGEGCHIFENTEAEEIESDPLTVRAGRFKIRCQYLMIAASSIIYACTATFVHRKPSRPFSHC